MLPTIRTALLAATLCLLPSLTLAWNGAGHRLVACIAWENLSDTTRQQLAKLLRHHPDYERWLNHNHHDHHDQESADEAAQTAFIEASTWPDDIRKDPRFYDEGRDEPRALLPGFPDMERRRSWHYVDAAVTGKRSANGELDRRLLEIIQTLGNNKVTPGMRAYLLPWLIHLVGDAHQPLHTASRYNAEIRSNEGGNRFFVLTPFHPRLVSMNLHAYWDDLPGPPWLRGKRLEAAAQALGTLYAGTGSSGDVQQWIEESRKIAHDSAYPSGNEAPADAPVTLSREFHERAQEIARQRVAQAGFRLAGLLNRLLNAP